MQDGDTRRRFDRGQLPSAAGLRGQFGGIKHARFHERGVRYHHLLRTVQGRFLLRPDERAKLMALIIGVLARAQEVYPSVRLYAHAWLSNHAHLILEGDPNELPLFTGFVAREISRRWGPVIGWEGSMFQNYESTALPTAESEHRAFRYVLAQSAKEHLVRSPLEWPGAHCAKDLVAGLHATGVWFDGTGYGKAVHQRLARKKNRRPPRRRDFERACLLRYSKLPVVSGLSDEAYRQFVADCVQQVEEDAAVDRRRTGRRVLGRRRVLKIPRETRSPLPRPPWFKRRRMICWADRRAKETLAYLERYWRFQISFRQSSTRFLGGELDTWFPPGAFRPGSFVGGLIPVS